MARKKASVGPRSSGLAARYEEARQKGKGVEPGAKPEFQKPRPGFKLPKLPSFKPKEEFPGEKVIKGKIKERRQQVLGARVLKREMGK